MVNLLVRDVYAQPRRGLSQYLGVEKIGQQLEGYSAEINLSPLVAVYPLENADALHQISHGKTDAAHFAGHHARRVDELLINANQHHGDNGQDQHRSHADGNTLTAGFQPTPASRRGYRFTTPGADTSASPATPPDGTTPRRFRRFVLHRSAAFPGQREIQH